jgi:hypothetical protein
VLPWRKIADDALSVLVVVIWRWLSLNRTRVIAVVPARDSLLPSWLAGFLPRPLGVSARFDRRINDFFP